MSFTAFYRRANQILKEKFPTAGELSPTVDLEFLISPHRLRLPKSILSKVEPAIRAHYEVCRGSDYVAGRRTQHLPLAKLEPRPDSVLMAYDFHTTTDGKAYLVEVNTNASMYLIGLLLEGAHGKTAQWQGVDTEESLWSSFQSEWTASGRSGKAHVAICDDDIPQQKMLVEFLMYQDWFASHGWSARLCEGSSFQIQNSVLCDDQGTKVDFVYNRLTDFLLEDPRFQNLHRAYVDQLAVISPHPWAYDLLADKGRLADMCRPGWLESIGARPEISAALREVLIPTYTLNELGGAEEVWSQRKNLFFKPRASHGGKSVYRGSSVSRKVFERMMQEDTIVQEFIPAQAWPTGAVDSYMENWKFDLRFYVYRDQIQMAVARSYQGQVTNFASRFGGLTAIDFI